MENGGMRSPGLAHRHSYLRRQRVKVCFGSSKNPDSGFH